MASEVKNIVPSPASEDAGEWENRQLCSDENCIGVIGLDGRCKECGKPYAGGPAVDLPRPDSMPSTNPVSPPPETTEVAGSGDEWARRKLCSDENCIGVIGPDGCCKECGKPYAD